MARRLLENPKVQPEWNSVVVEVLGDDEHGMTGARLRDVRTMQERVIEAPGMFVAIGHTPNTRFLNNQVACDEKGYIILKDPFRTFTSVDGVFAAGDVADHTYRQAITAAGMGCKAALDAERWLAEQGLH
jgi:thioredoxin reductase (NADPH)